MLFLLVSFLFSDLTSLGRALEKVEKVGKAQAFLPENLRLKPRSVLAGFDWEGETFRSPIEIKVSQCRPEAAHRMNVKWFGGSLQGRKAGLGSEHRRAFRVLAPSPGHREELRRDRSWRKPAGRGWGRP